MTAAASTASRAVHDTSLSAGTVMTPVYCQGPASPVEAARTRPWSSDTWLPASTSPGVKDEGHPQFRA